MTTEPTTPADALRALLAEARREYRDSDAAGDVLDWLDERAALAAHSGPAVDEAATGEPKPCPFCGGDPDVHRLNFGSKAQIGCKPCRFYMSGKWSKLLSAWNNRAPLSYPAVQAEGKGEAPEAVRFAYAALCEELDAYEEPIAHVAHAVAGLEAEYPGITGASLATPPAATQSPRSVATEQATYVFDTTKDAEQFREIYGTAPPAAQASDMIETMPCPDCKTRGAILYQCAACSHGNYPPDAQASDAGRGESVAWSVLQIGNVGAAYDGPNTRRAFTYDWQPGNVDAGRLGRATDAAADASAGDSIDRGLGLLKSLQDEGFGVFQIGATYTPASEDRAGKDRGRAIALHEAVAAIYFADSSDYESALWQVVKALDPDMVKVLEEAPTIAFGMTNEAADAAREGGQA